MDLHILFSQKPEEGMEAGALSLSLHLDDEVQTRCSEFVQKEIGRFKDHLQESYPQAKGGETDGSGEESDGEHAKKGKKAKSQDTDKRKRGCCFGTRNLTSTDSPDEVPKTAADLQREHVFIRVMLTFLRAIHAGAVHYKQCNPFLANYARLIEPFDICSKTIAEVLRNEAILAEHSEEVCQVIITALQDASVLTPPLSSFLTNTTGI
jgi:cohesin complex subunit SA-1/2